MRVAWVLVMVGCINDPNVPCGDIECAADQLCISGGCADPDAIAACVGIADGGACITGAATGVCVGGVCFSAVCGNGRIEPGEVCDDGNSISGDGCSSDCRSDETCGNGHTDFAVGEQCDDSNLLSSDGCSSTCQLETPVWRDVSGAPIGERGGMMMAFDSGHAQVVAFGGFSTTQLWNDTWLWNGTRWAPAVPVTAPSARSHGAIAYDSSRGRIVLFGGGSEQGSLADTWTWDGIDWTELHPATSPPGRTVAAMAYDAARDRIVLFGGEDEAGDLADTWEFDGTTWSPVTPTVSPPALAANAMAFDASRNVIVMSGSGRTWEYAGTTWTEIVTPGPANVGLAMAYDSMRQRVIAFGGADNYQTGFKTGLLSWDGATWTALANSTTPPARRYAGLAYDAADDEMVLYGGDTYGQPPLSDQWLWQDGWSAVATQEFEPPALWANNAVYDPLAGHIVMFGGVTTSNTSSTDTWIRDRTGWTKLAPATSPPDTFGCTTMSYDSSRQRTVLFGEDENNNAGTWEWDGTTWLDVSPPAMPPAALCGRMMAYDAATSRTVLFGGFDGSNNAPAGTWEWDGTTWTALAPSPEPPPRAYAWMDYDPVRQRIVLFGGLASGTQSNLGDTWEWDGSAWADKTPAISPSARGFDSFAYDPQRRRIVLYGGAGIVILGDQWEWDGTTWSPVSFLDATPQRTEAPMAYDAIQKQLVYFGGIDFRNDAQSTTLAQEYASQRSIERCLRSTDDDDGDGLAGCADPDCWARCSPLCPPGVTCPATAPHCGDGLCGTVEDHLICPADCP